MYNAQTHAPWTPIPPKKQHPVLKWVSIITGALVVLAVALIAVAAANGATGTNQLGEGAPVPAPSASAPAPVHKQTLQEWLAGPGGDALYKVQDDLTAVSKDGSSLSMAGIQEDGTQLVTDARAAKALPPPAPITGHYRHAMRDFIKAGHLMEQGDLIGATNEMVIATKQITDATGQIQH